MRGCDALGTGIVLGGLILGASGCQEAPPRPAPAKLAVAPVGPPVAAAPPEAAVERSVAKSGPAAEAWARWPMPNARLAGLPNPRSYETHKTPGVVVDRVTGLMWQRNLSNTFRTFSDAARECDALKLGGQDGWRLPSRIELVSLLDTTRTQPSIDIDAFPGTPSDWFWTSSLSADEPNAAWYVYFFFGYPKTDDITNKFSVRCVRSTQPPAPAAPTARYQIRANEVRDLATGLRWQRNAAPEAMSFEAARHACGGLRLGGTRRWRVPTLNELLTLIDERAAVTADAPAMIDRNAFPRTLGEPFWTSSTFANGNELAWYVRFDHGNGLYGRLTELFHVRCVI